MRRVGPIHMTVQRLTGSLGVNRSIDMTVQRLTGSLGVNRTYSPIFSTNNNNVGTVPSFARTLR